MPTKKDRDPNLAKGVGDVFLANACRFIDKALFDPDPNTVNIMEMITSATEICFAIELYLKAIWIQAGMNVPEIHELWPLFKRIPVPAVKDLVESHYESQAAELAGKVPTAELQVEITSGSPPVHEPKVVQSPMTLKEVLICSSDGFRSWRYIYESVPLGQTKMVIFPMARLKIIAEILRSVKVTPFVVEKNPSR